jgi:nucleotide-binding universal stress UspA family protein
MSIKSILVCLQPGQNTSAVLDVAVDLARRHKAHLAGLHVASSDPETGVAGDVSPAAELERIFREGAEEMQLSHEWRCVKGGADSVIALESRCHNILVIGQSDPTAGDIWTRPHDLLENILIKSGHPLLVVPHCGSCTNVGNRILIGWNGAREAARATEDAMPILKAARQVIVLTVDLRRGDALSVENLMKFLERHGVKAEARGARSHGEAVGDTMLSKAKSFHCDLLVMGGYGHSRTREHLIGGPTYSVVQNMTVPVLMSH